MNTNITTHEHEFKPVEGSQREECVCGAWRELVTVGNAQTWIVQPATYEVKAEREQR